jgi:hypothetical protein
MIEILSRLMMIPIIVDGSYRMRGMLPYRARKQEAGDRYQSIISVRYQYPMGVFNSDQCHPWMKMRVCAVDEHRYGTPLPMRMPS